MFCPNCGTQVPDGSAFCANCGAQLAQRAQTAAPPVPPQQAAPVKRRIRPLYILIAVGLVLVGTAAYVLIGMYSGGYFEEKGLKGAVIAPQTIIDNEIATVRVTGISYHSDGRYFPYCIGLEAENHTNVDLDIRPFDYIYVNGNKHTPLIALDVPAGQTAGSEDAIGFFHDNNKIKTVSFTLEFRRLNSDEVIFTSGRIDLKTSLAD